MSEKLAASIDSSCDEFDELLNPFVHHLELVGTAEKIKTALLTIVLLPIRVAVICFFLIAGWFLACVGLWGMSEQDLQAKPITGWRSLTLLWLTLTQVYSSCEIEFLPVYYPNEEEKKDPKLYAYNVRAVMAKALGIPVLDYTYDDCKLITRAKEMNLPNANALLEVQKIRHRLRLVDNATEEKLVESKLHCRDCSKITFDEFANYLNISSSDAGLHQLFKIYDKNSSGVIDFREYLLGVMGLNTCGAMDTIKIAYKIYDRTGHGQLPVEDFTKVLWHTLALSYSDSLRIFRHVDATNTEYVTYEAFKTYMAHRPEFVHLFTPNKEEKAKVRNGEICPNDYEKLD